MCFLWKKHISFSIRGHHVLYWVLDTILVTITSKESKMAGLIRRSAISLIANLISYQPPNAIRHSTNQIIQRTLFTSPVLMAKTRKRRKRYPFFWLQDKFRAYYDENLTPKNEEFFQQFLKNKYSLNNGSSPLKAEPWQLGSEETFNSNTRRVGLLAKKLDNHVIKYHSPEEYAVIGRALDRKRYAGLGCIVVGSDSTDPRLFTAEYNGLFNESGVLPKKKLTRFYVSHNARLEPGTPLLASHFRPGMFVDVYGKTIEFGRSTLRLRYKLKLGRDSHGVTKNHNRIGSIGRGRKECGPLKGRKMPGPYGGERRIVPGLKVWRVNTKYNLLYVQGPGLPGKNGSYLNIMDSRMPKKTLSAEKPPPFPTVTCEENSKLDTELFDSELHKASDPSIIFEITEEEKRQQALALRRIGERAKTAEKRR